MTAEERIVLINRRRTEFPVAHPGMPDFAYDHCSCGCDLVERYGDKYPTAAITGCPNCGRSWCD